MQEQANQFQSTPEHSVLALGTWQMAFYFHHPFIIIQPTGQLSPDLGRLQLCKVINWSIRTLSYIYLSVRGKKDPIENQKNHHPVAFTQGLRFGAEGLNACMQKGTRGGVLGTGLRTFPLAKVL